MNAMRIMTAEELSNKALEKKAEEAGATGVFFVEGKMCYVDSYFKGGLRFRSEEESKKFLDTIALEKGITGPIGDTGMGSYTGYIGEPINETIKNPGIGYTGIQEIIKRAADGTYTEEDFIMYTGETESIEDREKREEITNLSKIWMLQPLLYGGDNIHIGQGAVSPQEQKTDIAEKKISLKMLKLAIADMIITLGHYIKGEIKYQQTRVIKLLVDCKNCKGVGFKKKFFSKKFDKGTEEYKKTFRVCKHCNGNGTVIKDISNKSIQYIDKVIKTKRLLINETGNLQDILKGINRENLYY